MTSMRRVLIVGMTVCGLAMPSGMAGKTNAPSPRAAAPYPKRLTTQDVEKLTGWTGVKLVTRNSRPGAGGDLNFVNHDGNLILMAQFSGASLYKQSKAMKGYFFADVKGLGDDAFQGPTQAPHYMLIDRKGSEMITLATYFNLETPGSGATTTYLNQEQLQQLARIILSRP